VDIPDEGAVPTLAGAEQDDCPLSPEHARELTIDTMASWALDGLYPTPRSSSASMLTCAAT
jgi:hypothetical protein